MTRGAIFCRSAASFRPGAAPGARGPSDLRLRRGPVVLRRIAVLPLRRDRGGHESFGSAYVGSETSRWRAPAGPRHGGVGRERE